MKQLVCPISDERINEHVTRFNALFTVLLVAGGLIFKSVILLVFLMVDFYIRAFTRLKISPVAYVSISLTNFFNLGKKEIGKAQKIFAARLGFLMTLIITIFFIVHFDVAAMIFSGILLLFAFLESAFGICVGCMIYSYFVLPFYSKK